MRKITFLFLLLSAFSFAQITLSSSQLDFGDVLTTTDNEMAVIVTNTSSNPVTISDVVVFNDAFTYSLPEAEIPVGDNVKIRVTFAPKHNLAFNTELIFALDNGAQYRIDLVGNGKYEGTYYASTFNKTHQELKNALKSLLASGYTNLGYTGARDQMYGNIDNTAGKVTCVYTGRVATFNTRSGANSNSFNCEHTWPQSLFNKSEPERADIHHLFPTDVNANGRRGSYRFGVVSNATWSEGGSKVGGSVFEPRDEQKGATARAMLYFAIRYQDYSNFIDAQESILKQWHIDNPPTAWDIQRNNKIFAVQKNRNPFIDHPEFIERMNVIGGTDTKPVIKKLEVAQSAISYSGVSTSSERVVYLVNTGNQDISAISEVTSESGNVIVKSVQAAAAEGEVSQIVLGFDNLAPGTYTDKLKIDLVSQTGESIEIPITFTLETASVYTPAFGSLKVFYNPNKKRAQLIDAPKNIESLEVYDIRGNQIELNEISNSFTDIDFYGRSNGVYFVVVKTKNGVYTSRFLVY